MFNTFLLLLHEGGCCLDDVRHLKCEPVLMKLFGFKRVPNVHTLDINAYVDCLTVENQCRLGEGG